MSNKLKKLLILAEKVRHARGMTVENLEQYKDSLSKVFKINLGSICIVFTKRPVLEKLIVESEF